MSEIGDLRRATLADAKALTRVAAVAFYSAAWGEAAIRETLSTQEGLSYAFALEGEVVGFLLGRVAVGEAEILSLSVAPPHQRAGIARRLIDRFLVGAAAAGAGSAFLEVATDNGVAARLYGRAGFLEVGRRARYYRSGADALVLRRSL